MAAVVARNAEALGGAAAAASSATAGRRTAANVGRLLAAVGQGGAGLNPTLVEFGLAEFIGQSPLDVVNALSDAIAGDGATLEENAAREACIFVLMELFGEAQTYEELETLALDESGIREAFATFVARYVYLRLLPMLDQRLTQRGDPAATHRSELAVWEYTLELARLKLAEVDVRGLDWSGPEADAFAGALIRGVYEVFGE